MDLKKLAILPALALVAVLAAHPRTGWLVQMQLKTVFGGGFGNLGGNVPPRAARQAVAAAPGDFDLAFAQALETPGDQRTAALRQVTDRFPDRPEAVAALLRLATLSDVQMGRTAEQNALEDRKPPTNQVEKVSSPQALADFDAAAAQGEKIDPDNAYFPTLRAVGLLAAHRDDDARAALARAGRATRWDEYCAAEVHARGRLSTAVQGESGVVARMASHASTLYPHLAQVRGLSRVMLWKAIQLEKAGKTDEGIAIRRDLLAVSRTMRDQSTTLIGNLVGIAVNAIARSRPGGAPRVKSSGGTRTQQEVWAQTQRNYRDYADWAAAHGHPEEKALADADLAASKAIKGITNRGMDKGIYNLREIGITAAVQGGAVIVLANALWMVLLGGLAVLVARSTPIGRGGKLPASQFFVGSLVVWVTMALLASFLASNVGKSLTGVSSMMGAAGEEESGGTTALVALVLGAVSLIAPFVTWLVLLIRAALVRKGSFSRTVVLGMRGAALPVATGLLLVYAGAVLWGITRDEAARRELERSVRHEGRYYAQLLGERWPGDR